MTTDRELAERLRIIMAHHSWPELEQAAARLEQRDKDAEPEQPVAWAYPLGLENLQNGSHEWVGVYAESTKMPAMIPLYASPVRSDAWVEEAMRLADEYAERRVREVMSSLDDFEPPEHSVDDARAALLKHMKG